MPWVTLRIPRSYLVYHPQLQVVEKLEVREGETLLDLVRRLGLNELEFGVAVVNGERELMSYRPRDGEEIDLLPIIHGGAPRPARPGGGSRFPVRRSRLGRRNRELGTEDREPS